MKLFEAKEIYNKVLKEYASDDSFYTAIMGKKGVSNGKKADNIATGEAKPYKDNTYLTEYERKLPHLGKLTQRLKDENPDGALEVIGPALEELLVLIRAKKPLKTDDKGQWILPMGDNIRLAQNGQQYFIKYIGKEDKDKLNPNPNTTEHYDKKLVSNPA